MTDECKLSGCILEYDVGSDTFQTYAGDTSTRNGASVTDEGKVTLISEGFLLPDPKNLRL